jgi:hypothetical protein
MAIGNILGKIGQGLATGARVVGDVAVPLGKAVANEEAGYAPQIAQEQREHQQKMQDAALDVQSKALEQQLEYGQKYGTLTPQQQQEYVDKITELYSHPRHSGVLMEKLRKAIHPNGAYAQAPQPPLPIGVPEGGTLAADDANKLSSLQKTDDQKMQDSMKEVDFWTQKLKAAGLPDDQINAARNEAIERAMGAQNMVTPPKSAKLDIQGGVLVGGTDEHGRTFTNKQIQSGEAGGELKSMSDDFQKGEKDKTDAAEKKQQQHDAELEKRQERAEAAMAARQNKSEGFQESMLGKREQEDAYKKIDEQADNAKTLVDSYKQQYALPGNKSATDTALIADYTSVLAKGGRKTQAELQMAREIGNFKLNAEQRMKKLYSGELPDELRKMYLDYMDAAAKSERQSADEIKPDLGGKTGAKKVGDMLPKTGAQPKGTVSLAKARELPQYKGKSDADITAAAKALGYTVKP